MSNPYPPGCSGPPEDTPCPGVGWLPVCTNVLEEGETLCGDCQYAVDQAADQMRDDRLLGRLACVPALGLPGGYEWIIIGIIAVLLFGKRIATVAYSLGASITSFKRGLSEVDETVKAEARSANDKVKEAVDDAREATRHG